jgi:hypothetical protein
MINTETLGYVYNLNQHNDGLRFTNSLFSTQVEYINSMMVGGKISPKKANKRIKKAYKLYKKTFKNLENL